MHAAIKGSYPLAKAESMGVAMPESTPVGFHIPGLEQLQAQKRYFLRP